MANTGTATLAIAELREFASFSPCEQRYIKRSLDVGLGRQDAFKLWARDAAESASIRSQYVIYQELKTLRGEKPSESSLDAVENFLGKLVRLTAFDLAQEKLTGFTAYRFLYERLLGADVRPWLPSAFCAAAALPQIRPERRKKLLQSISEAAATAPGWSMREPAFYPEWVDKEAA
ncbi:hypothetical protein [Novosphingobium sp. KACC 22771]|uniref:hypothetical protein n=1 Tax=Novosphingobium sp. KACC 22771 TaxID=3025670 RepID=UPI002366ED19|nr:hypothetical protein [Novosphingobium sp. KACC 22771]WDF72840.1 hypothetical protein PQ467_02015 [Novosphingobium sp. KACC 22771]